MAPPPADVLLADANGRAALAVARSLSRRGVSFVAVGSERDGMVAASRHVQRYLYAPRPADDPEAFAEVVLEAAASAAVRLVMPLSDPALAICSERRGRLPPGARLAAAGHEAVRNVLDKRRNLDTAKRLGIRCPDEFVLEGPERISELVAALGLPLVLKNPGYGAHSGPGAGPKWAIVGSEAELRAHVARYARTGALPVFQQLVHGEVVNLCCLAARGTIVALHEYRSLRRIGWEGTSVLREVSEPTRQLADYAERLLAELEWDGVAQVAFVVGPRGDAWYMETNGRVWASVAGSIRIGWDFPYWAYRYFVDGDLPQLPPLAVGSKTCWRFGDLRLLGKRLRGVEPPLPPRPGKLRAIVDYLTAFRPGVHSDVFAADDPLPELVEHWTGLRLALARRLRDSP